MTPENCKVCGVANWTTAYAGPIRMGRPGEISGDAFEVFECSECGSQYVPALEKDDQGFYMSGSYRERIGESNDIKELERRHDSEFRPFFDRYPVDFFRDKCVVDVGCGGGSFLDSIKGMASETIAVELNRELHAGLDSKGHRSYGSNRELIKEKPGKADIVVSHSVIEHVDAAGQFLAELFNIVRPGGMVILTTPNRKGFLVTEGPEEYRQFFYRAVHRWYFDGPSLKRAMEIAGFVELGADYQHGFSLDNSLLWLRDGLAPGRAGLLSDATLDAVWKDYMIRSGKAERLIVFGTRP